MFLEGDLLSALQPLTSAPSALFCVPLLRSCATCSTGTRCCPTRSSSCGPTWGHRRPSTSAACTSSTPSSPTLCCVRARFAPFPPTFPRTVLPLSPPTHHTHSSTPHSHSLPACRLQSVAIRATSRPRARVGSSVPRSCAAHSAASDGLFSRPFSLPAFGLPLSLSLWTPMCRRLIRLRQSSGDTGICTPSPPRPITPAGASWPLCANTSTAPTTSASRPFTSTLTNSTTRRAVLHHVVAVCPRGWALRLYGKGIIRG